MFRRGFAIAAGLLVLALGNEARAQAPSVTWNVRDAMLGGSGCSKEDTSVLSTGNDLAVVFTKLGVELHGGVGPTLTERRSCSVRVPIVVPQGYYLAELTQAATYGATKTAGSEGQLVARSTFFNIPITPPMNIELPSGTALSVTEKLVTQRNTFAALEPYCSSVGPHAGVYSANFTVSGQRSDEWEDLILFVDDRTLRWDVRPTLQACPP